MKSYLLLGCALCGVIPSMVAADALNDTLAIIDTDKSMGISIDELDHYKEEVIDDPELLEHCMNSTAMFTAAGVAENAEATTLPEVASLLLYVVECAKEAVCTEGISVQVGDELHFCSVEEHHDEEEHGHEEEGHEHDDHGHDDHGHDDHGHDDHGHDDHGHDDHGHDDHGHDHEEKHEELVMTIGKNTTLFCKFEGHVEEDAVEFVAPTAIQWVEALGAVLIVCLSSLVGALAIVFGCQGILSPGQSLAKALDLVAFGGGVLLGAVLLHILPEASGLAENVTWKVGLAALGGISTATLVEIFAHHRGGHEKDIEAQDEPKTIEDSDSVNAGDSDESLATSPKEDNGVNGLVLNIVWGDAFHNFSDGVLIALSFALCGSQMGWLVTGSVVAHELPQEYIDFVLIVRQGVSQTRALLLNLLSSLSALVGAIVGLIAGPFLSPLAQGLIIAYGSGVLLYIALVELMPSAFLSHGVTPSRKLARFAWMVLGISLMGLLQFFHPHCEGFGHDHAH